MRGTTEEKGGFEGKFEWDNYTNIQNGFEYLSLVRFEARHANDRYRREQLRPTNEKADRAVRFEPRLKRIIYTPSLADPGGGDTVAFPPQNFSKT